MEKLYLVNQPLTTLHTFYPALGPYVLIFKTNIQTQGDKFYIKPFLDKHPLINQWSVDLEDVDCVLRIVTNHLNEQDIVELLAKRGYYCNELE